MADGTESDEMREWRAKVERETAWVDGKWPQLVIWAGKFLALLWVVTYLMRVSVLLGGVVGFVVFMTLFWFYAFRGKPRPKPKQ